MKLFFWGQFDEKEFAQSFCAAWRRQIGEVHHFAYRKEVSEKGKAKAVLLGIEIIRKTKPAFVINWQGNDFDKEESKQVRSCCDDVGAKFVYISLDDPFHLFHAANEPYKHAHQVITCCLEAKEIYGKRGIKNAIFAPPPCSIDYHIARFTTKPVKYGVFYYFTNPYIGQVYKAHGALNRLDTIRELLVKKISVGLASVDILRNNKYLSEKEWSEIEWKGFVPYERFWEHKNWAMHFNSSVVGRNYTYLNQRVFEIIGIGGVQVLDVSDKLAAMFKRFCIESGISENDIPILFYTTPSEFIERVEKYFADMNGLRRKQKAAKKIRWAWTFDHLVRRVALNEETFFDTV